MTGAPTAQGAWRGPGRWLTDWFESRLPLSDQHATGQRNIYIVPTAGGYFFAAVLLVLLVASINYQLSLGYALTFLLAGSGLASMHMTHGTLRGLQMQLHTGGPAFAGGHADVSIAITNPGSARHGIGLGWRQGSERSWTDLPARGTGSLRLQLPLRRRGWQAVPTLVAETRFPLGLFRAWTVWRPAARVLAWPQPEHPAPALPGGEAGESSEGPRSPAPAAEGVAFDGVRPWRRGDAMRQVAWKKVAHTGELVSRDREPSARRELWLDEAAARSLDGGTERRLSRLAAWVLAADRAGLAAGLRLGGREWPPDAGEAHKRTLLDALGTWGDAGHDERRGAAGRAPAARAERPRGEAGAAG